MNEVRTQPRWRPLWTSSSKLCFPPRYDQRTHECDVLFLPFRCEIERNVRERVLPCSLPTAMTTRHSLNTATLHHPHHFLQALLILTTFRCCLNLLGQLALPPLLIPDA
jgi:hypothetical protein